MQNKIQYKFKWPKNNQCSLLSVWAYIATSWINSFSWMRYLKTCTWCILCIIIRILPNERNLPGTFKTINIQINAFIHSLTHDTCSPDTWHGMVIMRIAHSQPCDYRFCFWNVIFTNIAAPLSSSWSEITENDSHA